MFRSKTRLVASTLGCAIAGFIICFFLSAEHSLDRIVKSAGDDSNLVMRQKDRF
ncbi:hypothetical protein ACFLS1_10695 [Verrucomicrobiota bacterium]